MRLSYFDAFNFPDKYQNFLSGLKGLNALDAPWKMNFWQVRNSNIFIFKTKISYLFWKYSRLIELLTISWYISSPTYICDHHRKHDKTLMTSYEITIYMNSYL